MYLDPEASCRISCEEIFGPLLPIIPYDKLDDAIAYVNAQERPLVTYVLSENKAFPEVEKATASGDFGSLPTHDPWFNVGGA